MLYSIFVPTDILRILFCLQGKSFLISGRIVSTLFVVRGLAEFRSWCFASMLMKELKNWMYLYEQFNWFLIFFCLTYNIKDLKISLLWVSWIVINCATAVENTNQKIYLILFISQTQWKLIHNIAIT